MGDKIIDLSQYRDDKVALEKEWINDEVMCLCGYRYIATYHSKRTALKKFECAKCGEIGKIFKTGQDLTIFNKKHECK